MWQNDFKSGTERKSQTLGSKTIVLKLQSRKRGLWLYLGIPSCSRELKFTPRQYNYTIMIYIICDRRILDLLLLYFLISWLGRLKDSADETTQSSDSLLSRGQSLPLSFLFPSQPSRVPISSATLLKWASPWSR